MQQLVNFIIKNKTSILFLMLFCLSIALTIQSHSFHKSKFTSSSNIVLGSFYESVSSIKQYFDLKLQNEMLSKENNRLKALELNQPIEGREIISNDKYELIPAQVNKNSYALSYNYITLNKGLKNDINEDYAVVTSNGIVGVVDRVSKNYSRVISILNKKSRINAKLKKTNHFGTLSWDGVSSQTVQLNDIQDLVKFSVGDTVITSGFSDIFPPNIPVGTVFSFELNDTQDLYIINVRLFNDMTNLQHVHLIKNQHIEELELLMNTNE